MKKIAVILFALLIGGSFGLSAQSKADAICGYYYAKDPFSKEGSQVKIYKAKDGTYEGIVCWVENPAKKNYLNYKFLTGFTYNAKEDDAPVMKRKVVRGGSWKDISYYIQVTTRDYEYQDTARSYIGFRTIQPYLGRNKGDNPRLSRVYR